MTLLDGVRVASAGIDLFVDTLSQQSTPVTKIDWRPGAPGSEGALAALASSSAATSAANDRAIERMQATEPRLIGIGIAGDEIDGLEPGVFLHAGPPIGWDDMSGPLRGAIVGGALLEGLADDVDDALAKAAAGAFSFVPCHERSTVGPMAGVVTPSMPVWIVEDVTHDHRTYCTLNEGLGKVLRYGAYDSEVIDRLRWMAGSLGVVLQSALRIIDEPLDLRALIAQSLQMGDELHNRNRAATSLLLRVLMPALLQVDRPNDELVRAVEFISGNDHFFLNLAMAASKATADAASGIEDSSIVVCMARNGTEFGVRLAGTGDRWFTGPAGIVDGLYLPGFGPDDANPDIGDSTITETCGLGGMAMAAAPAIVRFVGGTPSDAFATTNRMYEITWGESAHYQVPALDFRGTPLGIDCRAVVQTGILPAVNTGIAHREPGIGQVGAGLVEPPMEPFVEAVAALAT